MGLPERYGCGQLHPHTCGWSYHGERRGLHAYVPIHAVLRRDSGG